MALIAATLLLSSVWLPGYALADDAAQNTLAAGTTADQTAQEQQQFNPKTATTPFKAKGTYYIALKKNAKKTIGMKKGKRTENVKLVVSKKKNTNLLKFKISSAGNGLFYVKNIATGRLLTADTNAKGTGGTARMNAMDGSDKYVKNYQKWQIVVNWDKSVSFINPKTGLKLSLAKGKTKNGTVLKLAKAKSAKDGSPAVYQCFKLTKAKKNKKESVVLDVPCYWQNPQLPTGCESVALTNALNYWGFKLGKTTIAARWLPYGGGGVYNFIGNPYDSSGWIICAPGITRTANRYLSGKDTNVSATNVSGTSMKGLRKYLDRGYPVVVWTTMYMGSPWNYDGSHWAGGHRYPFYHNNHAVVLSGYNPKTGKYKISDSLSGKVWRSGGRFTSIYNTMGKQAVVIHDEGIDI